MNSVIQITPNDQSTTNKERFWKEQAKLQKESGLSRKAWCRQHQLSYDQFGYWEHKWQQQSGSSRLLPVNLNGFAKTNDQTYPETICTLVFKNGVGFCQVSTLKNMHYYRRFLPEIFIENHRQKTIKKLVTPSSLWQTLRKLY